MNARILFFDSGVGGLSVYQEVEKLLPQGQFFYCLDNAAFPYSEKSERLITQRVLALCQQINAQAPLDLIVIACNTASTVVLPTLREHFTCPIVGTVPAIKPAARLSSQQHLALIATKGTVQRTYVASLIEKFAQNCQVEKFGSTLLVEMAEQKLQGYPVDKAQLNAHLAPLKALKSLDTVVLGCTHFPFLREELQQALPQVENFVDSGKAIAQRVLNLLAKQEIKAQEETGKIVFSSAPLKEKYQQIFQRLGFHQFVEIPLA